MSFREWLEANEIELLERYKQNIEALGEDLNDALNRVGSSSHIDWLNQMFILHNSEYIEADNFLDREK